MKTDSVNRTPTPQPTLPEQEQTGVAESVEPHLSGDIHKPASTPRTSLLSRTITTQDSQVAESKSTKIAGLPASGGVMYAPFVNKDIVEMALGQNIGRFSKNKALYPVIMKNDEDKQKFEAIRKSLINEKRQDAKVFTDIVERNLKKGKTIL